MWLKFPATIFTLQVFFTMQKCFWLFIISWLSISLASAQTTVTGLVIDGASKEPLIGVSVLLEGKMIGTTTDSEGNFALETENLPPFNLLLSYMGYEQQVLEVTANGQDLRVELKEKTVTGNEVVVSASRLSENILKSPLSIDKIDIIEIRNTASADIYGSLANLRGVQTNTSSLTFTSINTRGFADVQNWRFIQLVDGAEMNAPGLNYPVGALSSPSDVDVQSMELVPGAGSALYGANAFNGMLSINTKSPFIFKGLNAELKSGITWQPDNSVHPYGELGIRYAWDYKDKFAFKVSASALSVRDWGANDRSYHITNDIALQGASAVDSFLNLPLNHYNRNAVNMYGDEVVVPLILDGKTVEVSRTGIAERDIIDYNQQVFKGNIAFHYRINEKLELSYDGRFVHGDAILRHTTIYPMVNLWQQVHKLELTSGQSFFRTYYSLENAGNSYSMLFTGEYIQEALKSTTKWAADYALAFNGGADGVPVNNHDAARAYADRDMASPDSEAFQAARQATLDNPELYNGGSKFVDKSSFLHAEGNYDFTPHWDIVSFQTGGSFRRYNLVSNGNLFNDGEQGFNKPIPVYEFGAYVQASKSFFKDMLSLRASARLDKNLNFPLRVTPRASLVFSWGKERNHNLRFAFQEGFRNPAPQETYTAVDIVQAVLLGGVKNNIDHYQYTLNSENPLTFMPAGTVIDGNLLYDSLVSLSSFVHYLQTGNKGDLQKANLQYLRQERITSFEGGYRAMIGSRLYFDANFYYNIYHDFVTRVNTFSIEAFRLYSVYTNIQERITSMGTGFSLEYLLPKDFKIGVNYSFATYNASEAIANNPDFLPSFNMPQHRVNASFSHRNVWKGLGFNFKYRWSQAYTWQSPFGQGHIPQAHILDAAIFYRIPAIGTAIKIGGTNLLRQDYQQVYGGPRIGSQIYISLSYDPLAYGSGKLRKRVMKPKSLTPIKPNKKNLPYNTRF